MRQDVENTWLRRPRVGATAPHWPLLLCVNVYECECINLDRSENDGKIGDAKGLVSYCHHERIDEAEMYSTQRVLVIPACCES